MADDILPRLVVSLDADITRLSRQLAKAGVFLDDFGKTADKKAGAAKDAINKHLGSGTGGLNKLQFGELTSAGRHFFDAIISGASPLRALAVEGSKASVAIGPGGLAGFSKQLATSLGGMLTPARIAAGGLAGIGLAAIYSYSAYEEAQRAIKTGLTGVGAASHATVNDIEAIGEQVAATSRISVSSARQIATAIAATGKVDVGSIGGIANLAKGFGNLTGKSLDDAGKELAQIFADPAKGVDLLNERIGALDGRTTEYVRTLAESGQREQAQQILLQSSQPILLKAADNIGVLTRAYEGLKSTASGAITSVGKGIAHVVDGPDLNEQLEKLQREQRAFRPFGDSERSAREAQIASLQAQIEARDHEAKAQGDRAASLQTSREATPAIQEADPAFEQIKQLEERLGRIGKAISENVANPDINPDGGIQHAVDAYNSLDVKLKELQKDYAAGGRFAAQALRQADFQKSIAGLSAYQKGLAQINFQYEQLIESARKDGNIRSLAALTTAHQTAIGAYNAETEIRAKEQIPVSPDLAKIIIGSEGNSAARNPNSTASGIGQFLDSTFIEQFQKVFSEVAASIRAQNTKDGVFDQKAYNASILSNKNDRGINEALITFYAHEIGLAITKAGFNGSDVRNQYLGYHFGPTGATKLLSADPNASAAATLGPDVTKANRSEVEGRTVQQLIDLIYERVARNSASGRGQQSQAISATAGAQAYDKGAAETARLSAIQEQLNTDREAGNELGLKFATAQDLIKASSDKLTPALQAQRSAILALAAERAKATQSALSSRFDTDQKNALDALGRTASQQQVFVQAKAYGPEGSDAFNQAASGLQKLQSLNEAKAEGSSFTKGLVDDLIRGTTAGRALENQLQRILSKLADNAIDNLFSGLFGGLFGGKGSSSGGSGIFGSLFHLATGGAVSGPGNGTSDSVPAMLSHGEYVVNAKAAGKNAGLLALINSGRVMKLASGGAIGSMPAIPSAVAAAGGGDVSITHAPTINMTPAQGVTAQQVAQAIAQNQRNADRNILSTFANAKRRFG